MPNLPPNVRLMARSRAVPGQVACLTKILKSGYACSMKKLAVGVLAALTAIAQTALATKTFSEDIASHIETIPIQTLTISDEQFLKGDASGRPATISGKLRAAQGAERLPLVILVHGSGGIEENAA